jgi:DnaJ-class molecular chaperone
MSGKDPYRELGLDRDATPEEIRAAFRRAARQRHPDTAAEGVGGGSLRDAIAAYHLLSDPDAKAAYDASRSPTARGATGPSRCRTCRGDGVLSVAADCPACRGHAEITDLTGSRGRVLRCRTCRGRGRVRTTRPCPDCRA